MAKWTPDEIEDKIATLEPGYSSLTRAFWLDRSDGAVGAWKSNVTSWAKDLPNSMVNTLMRSTEFDRDLYDTLVDTVGIDAVVAAGICLS